MKTCLLVIGHPRPDSFNYAIADTIASVARRHGVRLIIQDLYKDTFDPVLTAAESLMVQSGIYTATNELVSRYQQELLAADVLAVVHPNWWGKPPAMLSGWLDRVLAPGVAYKLQNGAAGMPEANLRLQALVVTTGDTPLEREVAVFGDPLAHIWGNCVLPYIGAEHTRRLHLSPVSAADSNQRAEWLQTVETELTAMLKMS